MARQTEWQAMIANCVEEMLRIVDEAESFVYDEIVPQLLEPAAPEDRRAFLEGLAPQFDQLKQTAPKLYGKYTAEALNMVAQEQAKAKKSLDDLDYNEYLQNREFRPEINPRRLFGLRAGNEATTTAAQGLDLPLGIFR